MMFFLIRVVLKALAFMYLLPMIPGIHFHGGLVAAIVLALLFSLIFRAVELVALALATYLTITTLGLALLVLVPLWVFGFWICPAIALKVVAHFLPQWLTVAGWGPAILGGLLMLVIGMLTGGITSLGRTVRRPQSA
jgi:uncharacterized membrane protein YvlD (DUF360 family)